MDYANAQLVTQKTLPSLSAVSSIGLLQTSSYYCCSRLAVPAPRQSTPNADPRNHQLLGHKVQPKQLIGPCSGLSETYHSCKPSAIPHKGSTRIDFTYYRRLSPLAQDLPSTSLRRPPLDLGTLDIILTTYLVKISMATYAAPLTCRWSFGVGRVVTWDGHGNCFVTRRR